MNYHTIEEALADIRAGKMVIVDDESREDEGDLIMAAEKITPEAVNFMAQHGRGLICVALTADRARALNLPQMVAENTAKLETRFTVSVDALPNTQSGCSAFDRAQTIRLLADPQTRPDDLARPGHIFPVVAAEGGVLKRPGHTEAAVDLARLAGLAPVGVICEIMNDAGKMARGRELFALAEKFSLKVVTIADLVTHRCKTEKLVQRVSTVDFPTRFGHFHLHLYRALVEKQDHLAIEKGAVEGKSGVLVRVHSQCMTGDIFHSSRCDCGAQLEQALEQVEKEGSGVLVYLCQEGRGIGLANKILAYSLQDQGQDTVEANVALGFEPDLRDYDVAAQILRDLGVQSVRLVTNNPHKVADLKRYGVPVEQRLASITEPTAHNRRYLRTKKEKMGHWVEVEGRALTGEPVKKK